MPAVTEQDTEQCRLIAEYLAQYPDAVRREQDEARQDAAAWRLVEHEERHLELVKLRVRAFRARQRQQAA